MCPSECLNWKVVSTKNILIQQERTWRETPGVICRKSMLLIKFLNFKYILGCFGRQLVQCVWCVLLCTAAPNVTLCHGSGPYPQCEWVQNCSSWCFHRADATSPHSSGQRAEPWLQFQVPAVRTMQQMHKEVAATTAVRYVDNILIMFGNWGSYHDPMLETLMAKFTRQRLHRNFGCQVQGRANAICTFLTTPVEPEPGEFAN